MRHFSRHLPWLLAIAVVLIAVLYHSISAVDEKDVSEIVAQYCKQLQAASPQTRLKAAQGLGMLRGKAKDAVPHLLGALSDNDFDVADASARALGRIGGPALPALRAALEHKLGTVRLGAAEALGDIGPDAKDSIPRLQTLMQTDDKAGNSAAWALARIGGEALPVLLTALKDKDAAVRYRVAYALGDMRDRPKEAATALAETLKDKDAKVRKAGVHALVWYGPKAEEAVPLLLVALADKELHAEACRALARVGPKAVEPLTGALQHPDTTVRAGAAEALTYMGAHAPRRLVLSHAEPSPPAPLKGAVAPLTAVLNDKETSVRSAAAEALGAIGPEARPSESALIAALKDAEPTVRRAAAFALGTIEPMTEGAVAALIAALTDEAARVRQGAAQALGRLGPKAKAAVGPLSAILKDKDELVRTEGAAALKLIDPEAAKKAGVP